MWKKILLGLIGFVFLSIIAIIAIIFFHIINNNNSAEKAIEAYLETHYGDTDFEIVDAFNNFPVSGYLAKVESPSSPDSHFEIDYVYEGRIEDTYEKDVLSGLNTFNRIEKAYEKLVAQLFDNHPLDVDHESIRGRYYHTWDDNVDDMFIHPGDLELDKKYDIHALGERHGKIDIEVKTKEIQLERVAEIILQAKEILDEENLPFRQVSLRMSEVKDDGGDLVSYNRIEVYAVPYEQINEEALMPYLQNMEDES